MLPFRRESRRIVYLILVGAILEILSEMCQEEKGLKHFHHVLWMMLKRLLIMLKSNKLFKLFYKQQNQWFLVDF